ncbi:MAG: tetratricopeptide repeat protein [Alphaproteobacteria bacterium]|nr:tetratricopeptide repeat protein [Alphaproteobacteria bacterium]
MIKLYQTIFCMLVGLKSLNVNAQNFNYTHPKTAQLISGEQHSNTAQLQVEIFQIQEQMRTFQGRLDELHNSLKQFETYLKAANNDNNARFEALEKAKAGSNSPHLPPTPELPTDAESASLIKSNQNASNQELSEIPAAPQIQNQASLYTIPGQGMGLPEGEAQRKYTYAQQLLQEKNYLNAEASFKDLIKQHPDDPIIVNARYWLAEISFLKRDYAAAAVEFGNAFETYQYFNKGKNTSQVPSKAPEILLKMALSLKELGKIEDAKVIVAKIRKSFPHMTADVKRHVDALGHELQSR